MKVLLQKKKKKYDTGVSATHSTISSWNLQYKEDGLQQLAYQYFTDNGLCNLNYSRKQEYYNPPVGYYRGEKKKKSILVVSLKRAKEA